MRVNNHVLILREAITKIVPMLTQRSVKVTQQGTRAYVAYSRKTHAIERVNLPYIPDDADDELLAATQGFLDHEVGHILFTDQKAVVKAEKQGIHWLHNLVEDTFVERKMGERFPGSGGHLTRMHGFFLREFIDGQLKEAPEQAKQILLVPAFRAFAGQPAFVDYMSDKWDQIEDVVDKLGKDFPKMLKSVESSWDSLKVAEEAKKRLSKTTPKPKAPPPPPPPPSTPEPPTPEDESADPPDPGMSDESNQDEQPTAGDSSSGVDPSPEDDLTGGEDPPPADDADVSAGSEPEPEPNGEDIRDTPEPENSADGDTDGDADPEGEGDEGGEQEQGDGMPGGDAAQGDESADGSGDADDADDEDGEGEDGASGASGADGEEPEGDSSGTTPGAGDPGESDEPAPSLFDELNESPMTDFDEAAAEALSKTARDATKGSSYSLFSRDFDDVSVLEVEEGFNQDMVTRMQEKVDHMIGPLQKSLERAVAARSASVWTGGHKSGRLHGPSLARIRVGRDDVFRRRQVNKTKDVAVELLVDCSGSMWSHRKIVIAAYSAYALSSVLDQLGIANEVLAFTTKDFPRAVQQQMMKEEAEGGFTYTRRTALRLAIVKSYTERMTPDIRRRFAQLAHCDDMMQENVDGESVQIAARRLMQQRSERKILKVLSDGMPACNGTSAALDNHLKEVVRQIEASGIDVVGLGILTDAVKEFYRSNVVLNDVNDLPTTVMKELQRLLLK
ncbi:TPA: hypothetical protein QDB10_002215 [Burkholderia vietnamiensis]|nr:hypothetical protein [Burkholderia vietnamiensis]